MAPDAHSHSASFEVSQESGLFTYGVVEPASLDGYEVTKTVWWGHLWWE